MAGLTLTDNADGTGLTGIVSGTGPAFSNTVRAWAFAGILGQLTLAGSFNRQDDGEVDLLLPSSTYFVELLSDELVPAGPITTVVGPQFAQATDGEQAIWDRVLDKVVAKLQSLPLPGINANEIFKAKQNAALELPQGITVIPVAEIIDANRNRTTDMGLGNLVTCYIKSNQNNTSNIGRQLKWRELIQAAFEIKPGYMPISDPLLLNVANEPASDRVFSPAAFLQAQYDAAAVVIRTTMRRPR